MTRLSPLLPCLVFLGLFSGKAAEATIAGNYSGRYLCRQWTTLQLQISSSGNGKISGVFTFPMGSGVTGSYSLAGQYDAGSGRFHLDPQRRLDRLRVDYNMVGMEGTFDASTRKLTGNIVSPNCSTFELTSSAAPGVPQSSALPANTVVLPANVPPERRRAVTNVTNFAMNGFDYWDSAMSDPDKPRESEPIDDVIDWLRQQMFSCVGTRHVAWDPSGTKGAVTDQISVRERFVVECDGNCKGVHYTPFIDAITFHFGLTQPVPVMEIKGVWFGGTQFRWDFTRPAAGPPPDIYVHRWTSSPFNSNGNCRAPKANNK
ncbi:MAG TPA: hypothetical protein VGN17_10680 [Bryobacteraceae bacterium]|jgi:hypothetical protein